MALIFSPNWFYGIDALFDLIGVIVAVLISYFSFKIYKYASVKTYKTMSFAFLFIAISYVLKILTNLFIYFRILSFDNFVFMNQLVELQIIYYLGFLLLRFAFLSGLVLLLALALRIRDNKVVLLLVYFSFITAAFSIYKFYIFYLTAAIVLGIIALFFRRNYCEKRSSPAGCIYHAFTILTVSNLIFVFVFFNQIFYVLGEAVQLVGYLVLLAAQLMVLKK